MRKDIINSFLGMIVFTLMCGVLFPLVMVGFSQVVFPGNANGQKVYVDGKLVGSKLIGQYFGSITFNKAGVATNYTPNPRYFQTRPSGTAPQDNDAATAFANYGPNSTITLAALQSNISTYLSLNCSGKLSKSNACSGSWYDAKVTSAGQIPVDAADTSASGVDPDISPANADIQAYRIAAVRHLSLSTVMGLVSKYTGGRGLGFSGEDTVNVLELNLALNRLTGTPAS
jgi:potassium-transporting ATPase KdpC subunit